MGAESKTFDNGQPWKTDEGRAAVRVLVQALRELGVRPGRLLLALVGGGES